MIELFKVNRRRNDNDWRVWAVLRIYQAIYSRYWCIAVDVRRRMDKLKTL